MNRLNRKSTPKVVCGKVHKKNNWEETPNYYNTAQPRPEVIRKRPGKGYRHLLKQKDIYDFIEILPDWNELSQGLNAIVLDHSRWNLFGYHIPGVVHICAWESDLWITLTKESFEQEREICALLEVPCEREEDGIVCKFTESTAKAHQLLATFLHELGHHHDRMSTKSKIDASRGEGYAEAYAKKYANQIWQRYIAVFGLW
ncbi:MAG: hypothetical protein L0220_09645 [Acidobacteria bacterium]|nr:hypothetical protein [Acidobacteriota bacterium]